MNGTDTITSSPNAAASIERPAREPAPICPTSVKSVRGSRFRPKSIYFHAEYTGFATKKSGFAPLRGTNF